MDDIEQAVLVLTNDGAFYKDVSYYTSRKRVPPFTAAWTMIARHLKRCDENLCLRFVGHSPAKLNARIRLYTAVMEHYFDEAGVPHNEPTQPTKEEKTMAKDIKIETKTFVNSVDVTTMSEEDFFKHINELKKEIERLEGLSSTGSQRALKLRDTKAQQLADLVRLFDSLEPING